MNRYSLMTFGLAMAMLIALPHRAEAHTTRDSSQMAAGLCQPFAPTPNVRYNASGMANVGGSMFFVVCSALGTTKAVADVGATDLGMWITNGSGTEQVVTCTARVGSPVGSAAGQLAVTKQMTVPVAATQVLGWRLSEFGGAGIPHPNFTCTLGPGMSINHVDIRSEEVV